MTLRRERGRSGRFSVFVVELLAICRMENAIDFHVLPEGCIANILSLTSPWDACRLSAVSSAFRSAAESDAIWERFLPSDYQSIISRSLDSPSIVCSSKKDLYFRLCDSPILIDGGNKSFSLEKRSGKKCYVLAARELSIVWADTPRYWRWISLPDSRFFEVAELIGVCWLEIRGKINTRTLSPKTKYAAYLLFKSASGSYGFEYHPVEVSVGIAGGESGESRVVYLDADQNQRHRFQIMPRRAGLFNRTLRHIYRVRAAVAREEGNEHYPIQRKDGWMEIELGEFFYEGGESGELEMNVMEVKGGHWKGGLFIQGIEVRPKDGK